jgi:hypothetical protein
MNQYFCPSCGSAIELSSINVATDVALCRNCGTSSPFSVLSGISELSSIRLENPPKSIRVTEDIMTGTKTIRYKRLSPLLFFLIPFTCLWSGGSIWMIYGLPISKGQFDTTRLLSGLPFLAGTIVMVSIILFCFFGKGLITIHNGKGTVFVGIGKIGWTRTFSYTRQTIISLTQCAVSENGKPCMAITIQTGDRKFRFGAAIPQATQHYLAAVLNKECRRI